MPAIRAAYVDDSVFDDRSYPEGWTWDDFAQDYAPRVSAATLDENVVTLSVAPGARAGDRAVVRFADGRERRGCLACACNAGRPWIWRTTSRIFCADIRTFFVMA